MDGLIGNLVVILILLGGLINFVPLIGVLSAKRLHAAYDLDFSEANLQILMRHRALLFGILGGFMLYAAFIPELQLIACLMGFISMKGFVVLMWQVGSFNSALKKIRLMDYIGMVAVCVAAALILVARSGG